MERIREVIDDLPRYHPVYWKHSLHATACEGGFGFRLTQTDMPDSLRGKISRTTLQDAEQGWKIFQCRFWSSDVGCFINGKGKIDAPGKSLENYDRQWNKVPEEIYRARLPPPKERGGTFALRTKSEMCSPDLLPNYEEFTHGEYDLFVVACTESFNLEMFLPLYRALNNCGFTILGTRGFRENGSFDKETMKTRQYNTLITYEQLQQFCSQKEAEIKNIFEHMTKFSAEIVGDILDFAHCYRKNTFPKKKYGLNDFMSHLRMQTPRCEMGYKTREMARKECEEQGEVKIGYGKDEVKMTSSEFLNSERGQKWLKKHRVEWPDYRTVKRRKFQKRSGNQN